MELKYVIYLMMQKYILLNLILKELENYNKYFIKKYSK